MCVWERDGRTSSWCSSLLFVYISIFPSLQEVRQVGVTGIPSNSTSSGQQLNESMQASQRGICNHVTTFSKVKLGIMWCFCYLIKTIKHKNVTATEKKSLVRQLYPLFVIVALSLLNLIFWPLNNISHNKWTTKHEITVWHYQKLFSNRITGVTERETAAQSERTTFMQLKNSSKKKEV